MQDVGDYNVDGHSDVLWRNDSGQVVIWEMNGNQIVSNHDRDISRASRHPSASNGRCKITITICSERSALIIVWIVTASAAR